MNRTFKDITGQKFGRLTALYRLHNYHKKGVWWLCVCECGNFTNVRGTGLRSEHTKSCGCLDKDTKTKHGKYKARLYRVWIKIKERCYNINHMYYKNYGGRGIAVCDEWKNDFMTFYDWAMSHGYKEGLQIDRIDNNGNYEPNNCRFISPKENSNNRRSCRYITIFGITKSITDWCNVCKINRDKCYYRMQNNTPLRALIQLIKEGKY